MIYLMEFNKEGLDHYVNVNNFPISQIPLEKNKPANYQQSKDFPECARIIFLCKNLDELNAIYFREREFLG